MINGSMKRAFEGLEGSSWENSGHFLGTLSPPSTVRGAVQTCSPLFFTKTLEEGVPVLTLQNQLRS